MINPIQAGIKNPVMKYWTILERDESVRTSFDALEYIERYTGPLDPKTPLIPVQVFQVANSNFFLLGLTDEEVEDDDPETN